MTIPAPLLEEVRQAVAKHQPELEVSAIDTLIVLEGRFVVSGTSGPFDFYDVKVGVGPEYPAQEPIVFETGGRIPKSLDHHVFPEHGDCCLGVWEEWLLTTPNHNFETFLNGHMHDYFVGQSHFEVTGDWPFGERSHGLEGVLESYAGLLAVPNDRDIVEGYLNILSRKQIKGHFTCPCGNGRKLRDCHRADVETLRLRIPASMAARMLRRILSY